MNIALKDFIILITGALLGCMLAVILMRKVFPVPHIVTVDIQGLMVRTSNRLSLQKISEEELKVQVNAFTDQLKAELKKLAFQKKLIILNAAGVLEGAIDITPLIEAALNPEILK